MSNAFTYIVGNLGNDPELRFTPSGQAVCTFSVAVTDRYYDNNKKEWADRDAVWYRCIAWRQLAENISESFRRGDRVIVGGEIQTRTWEDADGETRYSWELQAREVGASLLFKTARLSRVERVIQDSEPGDELATKRAASEESSKGSATQSAQRTNSSKSRSTSGRSTARRPSNKPEFDDDKVPF